MALRLEAAMQHREAAQSFRKTCYWARSRAGDERTPPPVLAPLACTPALEGRGRVLIADADLAFLEAASAALRSLGFDVTATSTTDQALALAEAQVQDALIVDIGMPGNQDLEFLRTLRARQPLLAIVVLTGKPALDSAVAALRLGVVDYLIEPPPIDELGRNLDAAVQHGRGLRSIDGSEQLASELVRRLHSIQPPEGARERQGVALRQGAARRPRQGGCARILPASSHARVAAHGASPLPEGELMAKEKRAHLRDALLEQTYQSCDRQFALAMIVNTPTASVLTEQNQRSSRLGPGPLKVRRAVFIGGRLRRQPPLSRMSPVSHETLVPILFPFGVPSVVKLASTL